MMRTKHPNEGGPEVVEMREMAMMMAWMMEEMVVVVEMEEGVPN